MNKKSRPCKIVTALVLLMMVIDQALGTETVTVKCGTTDDITNVGTGNNNAAIYNVPVADIKFRNLDSNCYGKTKETLLLLQEAIKEGEKCSNNASIIQDKLEKICTVLKPLNGYTKFEKVLQLLKRIHSALDNGTKFANNIPKVGKLRKVLVEKVMPVVLDALETINKGIRKVIDYAEEFLQYKDKKKGFKLLWEIDKKGVKVCTRLSPVGKTLQLIKSTIEKVHQPSKVILQGVNETQSCMSSYCTQRGKSSGSCSECSFVDEGFERAIPKITAWKQQMVTCNKKLDGANRLMDKLANIDKIFKAADAIITAAETFLKPIADKLEKFAKSLGPVLKNLMSCCPCGRPNPLGCVAKTVTNAVDLVTCPLDGITNLLVSDLLSTIRDQIGKFLESSIPEINIEITLPAANFEIDVPKFLQECFKAARFHEQFTKLCALPNTSLKWAIGTSFQISNHPSFNKPRGSFGNEITKSCNEALAAFRKFGKEMSTCFDRVDDAFFAIPPVGAIAALTCDPNYHDPDPGINYCPCKRDDDALLNKDQKQPYCVIWHRSAFKTCSSLCAEKNYKSGLNPGGGNGIMYKTHGYPYCERLEYYCRKPNAIVKNGRLQCSNEYIFLGGTCKVIPDPGYVCPVSFIECGSEKATEGVCWNYRFIECAKDDKKHFPMCTCRNSHEFQKGDLLCQAGKTKADTLAAVKEMRKSFSCFKSLGLEQDISKDCGKQMYPCVVQQPNVEAYHRCNLKRVEKFWDAHRGKFAIAGGVLIGFAVVIAVGGFVGDAPSQGAICGVLTLIVGIVLLACGLAIKTAEDDDDNYLKMGEVLL